MISVLYLVAAAITLGAATYKAVNLRYQHSRPAWAFVATLYGLGIALLLRAPVIADPIDTKLHVANVNVLIGNIMTLISAYCLLTVLIYFANEGDAYQARRKTRLWIIGLVAVLILMTGLFALSLKSPPDDFSERRSFESVAYGEFYILYLGASMIETCRLSRRYCRQTGDRYLRVGLRMVALGSVLGIVHCLLYANNSVAGWAGYPKISPGIVTGALIPAICCVLLVVGSTIGGWGPRLHQVLAWLADYRSYRKLGPLWQALVEVAPDVIPPRDMASLTMSQKRYRRVIEIRDLILTLRPYRDSVRVAASRVPATSAEPSMADLAAAEAVVIADAIRARREGRRPDVPDVDMPPQLGTDLLTESRWLEAVSAAYARSPEVPTGTATTSTTENGSRGLLN